MASIAAAALGQQLGEKLGEAKLGIAHGLKQQSLGDIYGIKDTRARLQAFKQRIKSGAYQPTRVDESGRLVD